MTGFDLLDLYHDHYSPTSALVVVVIPPRPYAMIEMDSDYLDRIRVLRSFAHSLSSGTSAPMPLEGLWRHPTNRAFDPRVAGEWQWTAGICLSPMVSSQAADAAWRTASRVDELAAHIRLTQFGNGRAAQLTHRGPVESSSEAVGELHRQIGVLNGSLVGPHHEIYLTDPVTTRPEEMCTLIRQAFRCRLVDADSHQLRDRELGLV